MNIKNEKQELAFDVVMAEYQEAAEGLVNQNEIDALDKQFESKFLAAEKKDEVMLDAESDAAAAEVEAEVAATKALLAKDQDVISKQLSEMEALGKSKEAEYKKAQMELAETGAVIDEDEKHPWSNMTAKQIIKFSKDEVVEVAKELGVEYLKPNGKVDTELNIAKNIVEKLK